MSTVEQPTPPSIPERRRKRRWGEAPSTAASTTSTASVEATDSSVSKNARLAESKDVQTKTKALQQSISERLAALKARKLKSSATTSGTTSATTTTTASNPPLTKRKYDDMLPSTTLSGETDTKSSQLKKAKVYDLDMSVTTPLAKANNENSAGPKKKANPYLTHLEEAEDLNPDKLGPKLIDNRLAGGHVVKTRMRNKALKFIEPGAYIEKAERKRIKAENAAKSGFVSGRKTGTFIKSTGVAEVSEDYYGSKDVDYAHDDNRLAPRADTLEESTDGSTAGSGGVVVIPIPIVMEWWDTELLPSRLKKEVISREGKAVSALAKKRMKSFGASKTERKNHNDQDDEEVSDMSETSKLIQKCCITASLTNSKTSYLVQHPVPVKPPNAPNIEIKRAPTLHLTKKERKRQRKLRREEQQRELQDMQAAGLIPAPEPKLTLSNIMRVLGDQAVMDPSKIEAKVREQMQARKRKHEKMNEERKLTKEQRSEKRNRKMAEDTSEAVTVALFLVKDMSHPYHRTKVDLNAQQNKLTGCVIECESPKLSLVIVEGGPKAIKRYTRLMMVRMKWRGENIFNEEEEEESDNKEGEESAHKFNPENKCDLVWSGMMPGRMFNHFAFQTCESATIARKVLEAKGVPNFWDQAIAVSSTEEKINFKI